MLIADADPRETPRALVYLENAIQSAAPAADATRRVVSRQLQFVEVEDGHVPALAGSAPYLDYRPPTADELALLSEVTVAPWLGDVEQRALSYAIEVAVPEHLADVRTRTLDRVDRTMAAVKSRLTQQIAHWRQDGFAHADAIDEASGRFVGLRAGEIVVLADPVGLLIRPEAAEAQLEAERSDLPTSTPAPPDAGDGAGAPGRTTRPIAEKPPLRRFFGTVALDPTRLSRDASEVGEAVVAHLNGLVGAEVHVTLEIHAEIPDGAPEDVVRTVTENAMTLRFDPATGFEAD